MLTEKRSLPQPWLSPFGEKFSGVPGGKYPVQEEIGGRVEKVWKRGIKG